MSSGGLSAHNLSVEVQTVCLYDSFGVGAVQLYGPNYLSSLTIGSRRLLILSEHAVL